MRSASRSRWETARLTGSRSSRRWCNEGGAMTAPALDLTRYQDPTTIRDLIRSARTVAIVGLSPNVLRPSYFVGFYLQRHGYRIVPVNPKETEILGETSYSSLSAIPFPVDVVDVFRAP